MGATNFGTRCGGNTYCSSCKSIGSSWTMLVRLSQVEDRLSDVDLANGEFVDVNFGKSAAFPATGPAAGAGLDRWSGFEYTPVHLSYR